MDLATRVVWSGGHRLASKLAARRDVSAQNGQIVCTRKANPPAVEADFEGDHISGERFPLRHSPSNRGLALTKDVMIKRDMT